MNKTIHIKLVSLKEPCTACIIIDRLIREMLMKLQSRLNTVSVEFIQLEDLKKLYTIEGLEVEKFPAILVNDEQITAGSLPSMEQLLSIVHYGGVSYA